ncbi:hypothetical protein EVG20_g606 [Dentipellis fragilis]|uniref:40S ribosomal protein S21 n=1 Tax=Dentipellis fragilis TaxID=205917 RepID=A0A4Y9ZC08_9AGAM|nr:hypothetical protein EVG20_g606 [Dentipellis fragilis]
MENDQGVLVDLYVPRKCSATNRLITSKDHASVQISVADVDANGRALSTSTSFALSGPVRSQGESDDSINRLATKAGREYSHLSQLCAQADVRFATNSPPECLVIPKVEGLSRWAGVLYLVPISLCFLCNPAASKMYECENKV